VHSEVTDGLKVPLFLPTYLAIYCVKMQHSFPAVSPFLELIQRQERSPDKIILRDHSSGVTATAGQLLRSVSSLREELHTTLLQNGMYDAGNASEDRFIFMIAPPGWEYVVSMLTIFSLGAAMSAQCKMFLAVEQFYHAYSKI